MKTVLERIRGVLTVAVMGLVLTASSAIAQPMEEGPMKDKDEARGKKHFAEMFEKLKLTKEQRDQLDKNREAHKAVFEDLKEKISAKHQQLRTLLDSPVLDIARVKATHQELKDLLNQKEDQHLAAILEVREILTPEQFVEFQKMAPDRKGGPFGRFHDKAGRKGKK